MAILLNLVKKSVQENYRKTTEMVRPCEKNERGAHSEKNVRCGHTGKRRRGRPNLRWKDTCKRDMTEVGLKSTTRQTGQHLGIRSSAIPATPDDGTSQGRRRRRISYNDGAVYFALRSGWVKHTLTKGLNRRILRQSNHVWWKCGRAFHMLQYPKRNHRNQTRRKTH